MTTLAHHLTTARQRLSTAGVADPVTDARLLIGAATGFSLTDFVLKGDSLLSDDQLSTIEAMIARRENGEPVHRILGHREFYSLDLLLSPETLEPRPDTEILVDAVLPYLDDIVNLHGSASILDMGIGTGAICLALLNECPAATGVGTDISKGALVTAAENAKRNGLADRFKTQLSNWFDAIENSFDIIVSNPPYIRRDVIATLERDVRQFDPMAALDGGEDGLDPYRAIARGAPRFLNAGGIIGVEIGYDQKIDVTAIFADEGYDLLNAFKDYGGNDRALIFGT
ncbi:protein methyltransferase HemK [Agrobacterium rubi TR3 = NBRC 13261]|uniref:Release factor glutamine methyltransferase n=1 Tax=Agrobacterium rubi TR3 = NBRC 13261 TaxID=1368415 RepID=A0A081D0N2_9HYPH|nr:peptide chain release factor N(5)-glutamine methyltransferase [Agrobacterium rubi]MBP1881161.1 release factor glutamine methyltransferase [Agrobacterium rubi]MCL6650801.1 protein-(glutamine-N5) methyltransferase, release factor-specific [Agrobacterium rubi]GAK72478.1 protein methyltransferase HemK [Agrobacterium rubi TR3 = NBRC 13261]